MANYGQYNRNHQSMKPQVTSEEAADALEQSIFDSDHLWEKYRDDISPLLQQAELRLGHELKEKKFNNMENIIKTHVDRWYRLTKNLSAMTLNFRTQGNHIIVKLDSLKNEIEERDKIIRTQRKDYENEKDQYENQLKVLESALADSIPRNKTLSKYEPQLAKVETNQQIQQLTKDLAAQEQQYQKLKIENQRLSQNLKLLNSGANDFQQTLTNLNNEIAKKEDEILSLRWLTQDLAAERNGLEQKIQTGAKDPNFTSVTPQRQMNYDIDLSAFLDGDEDVSDDAVENGMMFLEMNDDADINPEVAKKLAEALEAVRKVTQFANDRDYEAKQLEDKDPSYGNQKGGSSTGTPLILPNIKEYQKQWLMHKALVNKLIEQLHATKQQCNTIMDVIKPIKLKRNILQELPDTKRTHVLSIFDRVDTTVQDFEPTSEECIEKFHELIKFFNVLMEEASKHDDKHIVTIAKTDDNAIDFGSSVNGQGQFLDHEAHLVRRQQYAEVIVDLEEYLTDARKHCQTISAAMRNGASEMAKSDDKSEWLSVTTSIARNAEESLKLIQDTLDESLKEIQTAGILLMQNDKQIERYQEQLAFLTSSLEAQRKKYHDDVESYSLQIRKAKDRNAHLNEERHHQRGLNERRNNEVRRLQREAQELTQRFENKMNDEILNASSEYADILLVIGDENVSSRLRAHFNHFESCFASESELRFKCSELSRHLDESKLRRQYEKCNYKKKLEQIRNSWDQEKMNIENRHNMLIEKLQDEIQLWRSTNGSSNFDVQVAMEQMEDALHEAHIQIRDKDDEIEELRSELAHLRDEKHANPHLALMAVADDDDDDDAAPKSGSKLSAAEMRKGMELYDFICCNLKDFEREKQCDMHESLILLAELKHEMELYGDLLNERDYAIHMLEDRLNISQNATTSIHNKYNKIRHKIEAEQQQQEQMEMKDEHEDVLSNLPPQQQKQQQRHNPDVRPGDSHDDIVLGRRKSLLAFHQAFDNEAKRRSQTYDNKLQKEDRRRSRHSSNRRRRSSVSNVVGLLLPLPDMGDPQSKSDIGGHKLEPEELDDDDDKLFVNSLRRDVRAATTARPDSAAPSPAPSPRNSPTQNANSPMGSAADEFELNIADAVDDELLNVNVIPPPRDQVQLNRQKDKDIELLKTQIDGKAQLVRDLKQNVQELTENRRRELMHFQGSLETMKSRCREWYEQLMARVREMELTYQDRVNEEVERRAVELHRELADERRRMRDEFEKQLAAQQQTTADLSSNPHEIDELSREIARLNEELEKFKGKYFDSEQQKIELADALDELKEEKFKMEEKLEVSCTTSVDSAIAFYEPHKDNIKSNEYELSPTYSTRFAIRDKPQTAHVLATVEAVLLHMRNHVLVPQFIFDTVLCFYAVPINIRYKTHINQFLCCPITDSWHSIALNRVVCIAFGIRMCVSATLRFSNGGERVKEWKPDTWKETDIYDVTEEHLEYELEIERLNEQLEKFKNKYFDAEQQKIEFEDQLDEIKEEKFIMEERIELGDQLVQKLRIEKENLITQHEEELRAFERMANEKVAQLEEYYVQQLQINHVHVQQLQQQLQQQPINQDNMNQLNSKMKLCSIIHKNVAIMMRI
eukprot:532342_1